MLRRSMLLHMGAATVAAALLAAGPAAAETKLTVYTALENEQLKPLKDAFEKANPGIEIVWVRDSTGVITARILAEKDNPHADVIWGVSVSSVALFEQQGMLQGYSPKGVNMLKPKFHDAKNPMMWTGIDAYASVIVFNTKEGAAKKVKQPHQWADLTSPAYKGMIVMPNPASSGTGYLMVSAWLQSMGEKAGWAFMDKLHQNIASYTHSGSAPCVQAARGERVIGLCLDMRGASEKTKGAPIALSVPRNNGWEIEATAIVKGTKNLDAAKKLVDWTVSKEAGEIYGKTYALVAHKAVKAAPKNYPADMEAKLVKNDFGWMGKERGRILAEWTKRYDSKSDPKKK
ncbi:MAG: putative 2-aminoethylphosphonate ABC transporter substrate-binding protein [Rhodospirillaceae bacterium]|nr:putative 2-aminoethylphosphonate ABC transporter substrate-binding protein [Rhodospirillaceae bacterium]